jgi:hypothetical protein
MASMLNEVSLAPIQGIPMKSLRHLTIVSVCLMLFINPALALIKYTDNLFGNSEQPGHKLHQRIVEKHLGGIEDQAAINAAIEAALEDDDTLLGGKAKASVAFDVEHAGQFYNHMSENNSLIDVTKKLIEQSPDKAVHTITLGVTLYPDHAQDVFDGAALTGVMASDDILVAAIQAGADPSSVSDAPAAGDESTFTAGPVVVTVTPVGTGIGAGGSGGGDTTASTN